MPIPSQPIIPPGGLGPRVRNNISRHALNQLRSKICPNSPFWSVDLDLAQHRKDWTREQDLWLKQRDTIQNFDFSSRFFGYSTHLTEPTITTPTIPTISNKPFNGRTFTTNRGSILPYQTIFCPTWDVGREHIAPWPTRAEARYEGDDRISTDRLHARFPGAPRVDLGDDTIGWQQRPIIAQYPFDDFYFPIPQAVDVFMRSHYIADLEFDDEDGREILGSQLLDALDTKMQW